LAGERLGFIIAVTLRSMSKGFLTAFLLGAVSFAGCADRPLPFPGPDMAVPASTVAKACATMTGCGLAQLSAVGSFASSMETCVNAVTGIERRDIQYSIHMDSATIDCLAAAGSDCTQAQKCTNGGTPPSACSSQYISTCDGNIERRCTDGQPTAFDCASIGLSCYVPDPKLPEGACGYSTCNRDYITQCFGDVVANCVNSSGFNVLVPQTDCAAIGGTCAQLGGAPACQGKGDTCADGSAPTCQDNFAVSCLGGRQAILDCTGARQRCVGGKCVPFDNCEAPPKCDGTLLTVCGPNGSESVDCAALGFPRCDPTNGGRCTNG
jgi:hypothetical protein